MRLKEMQEIDAIEATERNIEEKKSYLSPKVTKKK